MPLLAFSSCSAAGSIIFPFTFPWIETISPCSRPSARKVLKIKPKQTPARQAFLTTRNDFFLSFQSSSASSSAHYILQHSRNILERAIATTVIGKSKRSLHFLFHQHKARRERERVGGLRQQSLSVGTCRGSHHKGGKLFSGLKLCKRLHRAEPAIFFFWL